MIRYVRILIFLVVSFYCIYFKLALKSPLWKNNKRIVLYLEIMISALSKIFRSLISFFRSFVAVCSKYTFGSKGTFHGLGNAPRN